MSSDVKSKTWMIPNVKCEFFIEKLVVIVLSKFIPCNVIFRYSLLYILKRAIAGNRKRKNNNMGTRRAKKTGFTFVFTVQIWCAICYACSHSHCSFFETSSKPDSFLLFFLIRQYSPSNVLIGHSIYIYPI